MYVHDIWELHGPWQVDKHTPAGGQEKKKKCMILKCFQETGGIIANNEGELKPNFLDYMLQDLYRVGFL